MNSANKILVLIGPKGSGKSYIGRELESLFPIKFLRIEQVWQELKISRDDFLSPDYVREGHKLTLDLVESSLRQSSICIEATGAADDWDQYVSDLKTRANVVFIKVACDADECKKRAEGRDQSLQVKIPEEFFDEINKKSSQLSLD